MPQLQPGQKRQRIRPGSGRESRRGDDGALAHPADAPRAACRDHTCGVIGEDLLAALNSLMLSLKITKEKWFNTLFLIYLYARKVRIRIGAQA